MLLQWLKGQIYDLLTRLVKLNNTSINKNTLLLIRTSNMGDYVLWRDMLKLIRQSDKYRDYHIALIGNKVWRNLFESLDSQYVDEVIWADMFAFKSDLKYRYSLLKKIEKKGFEVAINTIYSRCKRMDDAFMLAISDKTYKIGYRADLTNVYNFEIGYDKNLYNEMFATDRLFEFDFTRTVRFTEFLLKQNIPDDFKPELMPDVALPDILKDKKYFVVFPGSSSPKRIWNAGNFANVIEFAVKKYGLKPVLCGSKSDETYINDVLSIYKSEVINLCGKTSQIGFAKVLKEAEFLISIDTGAVHLGAVVGCMVFAIYNGSHYGRYDPYPAYINPYIYGIYPDEVETDINSDIIPEKYSLPQHFDYNSISPEKVCNTIKERYINLG